jgi:hypothetical protein
MTDADLDLAYTTLCEQLATLEPSQAPLFLSILCLDLMSRLPQASDVLPLIERARAQCALDAQHG